MWAALDGQEQDFPEIRERTILTGATNPIRRPTRYTNVRCVLMEGDLRRIPLVLWLELISEEFHSREF